MIIHITGMDSVGKSTLAERLSKQIGAEITHFSNPKDMEDGKKQYESFLKQVDTKKDYICDRFHDGEWVYAPIYRGYMANYMHEFEDKIRKTDNYMLAYIKSDLQTIIDRIKVRGEEFVKEEHYQTVIDNFHNNFILEQQMPCTIIDTTNGTVDENHAKLYTDYMDIRTILEEQKDLEMDQMPRGNINAKYMIVGQDIPKVILDSKYDETYTDALKIADIYTDCWFAPVSEKNLNSILNQINMIRPKYIITIDPVTNSYIRQYMQTGKDRVIYIDPQNYDDSAKLAGLFQVLKTMD